MKAQTTAPIDSKPNTALDTWRASVTHNVLVAVALLAIIPVGTPIYLAMTQSGQPLAALVFGGCYVFVLALAIFRRLDTRLRAGGLMLIGYIAGTLALARGGLAGDGRVYLMALPPVALVMMGIRSGVVAAVLSMLIYTIFTVFVYLGWMDNWLIVRGNTLATSEWVDAGLNVLLMMAPMTALLWRFARFQERTLQAQQQAALELEHASNLLQQHAIELGNANTRLAEQARALASATEVAQQVTSLQDEQNLLDRFVQLAARQFQLHHISVLLSNPEETYAVLRAASSEAGRRLAQHGHQIAIGPDDPVGQVIQSGQEKLYSLTPGDYVDMPGGRWRVILPLQAHANTLGALDVHYDSPQAPSTELCQVLRSVANQLAVSLENTRLFHQLQEHLELERQAQGQAGRQGWLKLAEEQSEISFHRNRHGLAAAEGDWRPEARIAVHSGRTAVNDNVTDLAVPIKVRDQVIGVIEAHRPAEAGRWSAEQVALLETLNEQLGVALDSARLYQDTQRRAARERLSSEVAAHMRQSLDIDTILQVAALEMKRAFGALEAEVRVGTPPETNGNP